ncbi:MAG: response regulator [Candidatus Zapsychrus exili]|nr:response regulator [Candidatus Zapsychrus exili]
MNIAKILIVDDEKENRENIREYLANRIVCEIADADNGYKAIEKLELKEYDILISDITMPGISGQEVLERAKELYASIAIIVVTKWDSSEMANKLIDLEVEYMPKPISLKVLKEKVALILESKGKLSLRKESTDTLDFEQQ